MSGIQGLDDLRRVFASIKDKTIKKAVRAGLMAGLKTMATGIRTAIDSAPLSPPVKHAMRESIGTRITSQRKGATGKAGVGVGKPSKKQKEATAARGASRKAFAHKGVGLSSRNIHWFVLGTQPRHNTATGRYTGAIKPVGSGLVAEGVEASQEQAIAVAGEKIQQVLAREAAKK